MSYLSFSFYILQEFIIWLEDDVNPQMKHTHTHTHAHYKQMHTTLSGMAVFLSLGIPTESASQTASTAKHTGNTFSLCRSSIALFSVFRSPKVQLYLQLLASLLWMQ